MKEGENDAPLDRAERLLEQAQEIRQISSQHLGRVERALAPWQQMVGVLLVILVLAGSVALLVSGDWRERLLERIAASGLAALEEPPEVYRVPPPPPRPARSDLRFSSQPTPETQPLVVPVGEGVMKPLSAGESRPAPFSPPVKNSDWESAFRVLQEESEVVGKLIGDQLDGLHFEEWEPLTARPPSYSIKLNVFRESEQRMVVFAWSVDVSTKQTRPENQEARDLFFRLRRQ